MTIEYRTKSNDRDIVVTTACPLCGESLADYVTMPKHLVNCPKRDEYAEVDYDA